MNSDVNHHPDEGKGAHSRRTRSGIRTVVAIVVTLFVTVGGALAATGAVTVGSGTTGRRIATAPSGIIRKAGKKGISARYLYEFSGPSFRHRTIIFGARRPLTKAELANLARDFGAWPHGMKITMRPPIFTGPTGGKVRH